MPRGGVTGTAPPPAGETTSSRVSAVIDFYGASDMLTMPLNVPGPGRTDAELASLRDFVSGIPEGACALVLEGEAGIGKTTLWRAGVEAAEAGTAASSRSAARRPRR